MTLKTRQTVYEKFGGRCAYCGREIAIKDMQVDHIDPQHRYVDKKAADRTENLFPSCRRCNHYKRGGSLEYFRIMLLEMQHKVLGTYVGKVAVDYGMVGWKGWDGMFYFERQDGE